MGFLLSGRTCSLLCHLAFCRALVCELNSLVVAPGSSFELKRHTDGHHDNGMMMGLLVCGDTG